MTKFYQNAQSILETGVEERKAREDIKLIEDKELLLLRQMPVVSLFIK